MFRDRGYSLIKKFEEGGVQDGTRPLDLRTMKYSNGGVLTDQQRKNREGLVIKADTAGLIITNMGNFTPQQFNARFGPRYILKNESEQLPKNMSFQEALNFSKNTNFSEAFSNKVKTQQEEKEMFENLSELDKKKYIINNPNSAVVLEYRKNLENKDKGSSSGGGSGSGGGSSKTAKIYSKLFNDVKMEDLEPYLPEARELTGIEDFNPLNAAHTKKLQEALLARSDEFDSTYFSGKETDILQGDLGVNKQGVDGKFGIDTFNALKESSEKVDDTKEKIKEGVQKVKKVIKDHGYNALTLLKAGTGIHGIGKALKNIEIGEEPELSASFRAFMNRAKELSESGIDPVEKARMKSELGTAYNAGVKNAMRAAGGSRGAFLANAGVLNANRVNGLLKLAALDNEAARANMKNYGDNLRFQEKYLAENRNKTRDMKYEEDVRQANVWGQLGSGLLGMAFEDFAYAKEQQNMKPYYDALVNKSDMTLFEHQSKIDNQSLGIT